MKIDSFLLMSGEDIPLTTSNIIIHNPTIREIVNTFLFENSFLTGFEFLFFSKDKLDAQEKYFLDNLSDFEILLTLLTSQDVSSMSAQIEYLKNFLQLLFKYYDIEYQEEHIVLKKEQYVYIIDEETFSDLKEIVNQMFPFKIQTQETYNPQGRRAKEIAEKIKKGREKIAKQKEKQGVVESLFEKYISILSIGLKIPIANFFDYTVYQIFNMFERYEKKEVYDVHLKAQLAGATGMKEVDHWMM